MLKRLAAIVAALALTVGAAHAETLLCIDAPGLVALTDRAGAERIENGRFEHIFTVRDGALYAAGEKGEYRLFDAEGQPLGDAVFSMIDDEGESLVFRAGGLYGAMDDSGKVLLEAEWTQLTADGVGGWLALDGDPLDEQPDEMIHIDASGAQRRTGVVTASGLCPLTGGRMPYMNERGLWGAVNGDGAVVIEPVWRYMGSFEAGAAKVAGPGGFGLIDAAGRVVVAARYGWLERGATMTVALDDDGLDVYPARGGQRRFRLPGPVREVSLAGKALAVTTSDGVTLYDASGKLLAKGASGMTYAPGSAGRLIASDGEWGEKCQWLVNPDGSRSSGRFQQILPLRGDRYAFLEMDGIEYYSMELERLQKSWDYAGARYGLMDGSGRILLPAEYLEIRALSEDRLLLVGEDAVVLADRNGAAIREWLTPETEAPIGEAAE